MRLRVVAFMIILALLCLAVLIRFLLILASFVAVIYCFAFLVVGVIIGVVLRGVQGS